MKLSRIVTVGAVVCGSLLLPMQAQAQRLRPAHPYDPVAFTFPAVRYVGETGYVRRVRVVKRLRANRHASVHRRSARRVHMARSYRLREFGYAAHTGWRPLPYEFGPYNAAVVVLRP